MNSSRRLPIVVNVPNPCEVDWEDMVGNDHERFCGQCGKTVKNLSVLDGDEVRAVLARGDCVSFLYRKDASVITAESGAAGAAATPTTAAAVVLAAAMALTLGCDGGRPAGDEPVSPTRVASETAGEALQSREAAGSEAPPSEAPPSDAPQSDAPPTRTKVEAETETEAIGVAAAERAPRVRPASRVKKRVERAELSRRMSGFPNPGF